MTNITDDILAGLNANQSVYSAAYNEGVKAGIAQCRRMITDLCSALDDVTPDEGEDRNDVEELIAEASALLNGIRKGRE